MTVSAVGSLDDAIEEANAPAYGLTAGIFSADEGEQERFLDDHRSTSGRCRNARRAGAQARLTAVGMC